MIFIDDIEKLTLENTDYRRVIFTSNYSQLVLMSIPPGEDIELEIHPHVDQFFRIEQGTGEVRIGKNEKQWYKIQDGTGVIVPYNTYHRVINTGDIPLKLYSIYSPPNHPKNLVEPNKVVENNNKYKRLLFNILL